MDFEVRSAERADAEQMAVVHVAAWQAAYRGVMPDSFLDSMEVSQRAEYWRSALESGTSPRAPEGVSPPANLVATAVVDGGGKRVIAISTVGEFRDREGDSEDEPTGELWMLNAHPDYFGSGAASALHREAIAVLGRQGHTRAVLWVVAKNPRARRFYEREGWLADGHERTEHIGDAEVVEARYSIDVGPS